MISKRNNLIPRLLMGATVLSIIMTASMYGGPTLAIYGFEDPFTQGSWLGNYGANGYMISNGPSQNAAFGTSSVTGGFSYSWASNTADPRALISDPQDKPPLTRIASAYTNYQSKSFTINYTSVDSIPEVVSLYLLDWDTNNTRSEMVTVKDASTGAVLDQRTFSNFKNGKYEVYLIVGNVTITVTPVSGYTPVVSGVFFGFGVNPPPPNTSPSSASYQGFDGVTNGNWPGVYGSQGYSIASNGSSAPTFATYSVTGTPAFSPFLWNGMTSDVRALLRSGGSPSNRIAAAFTNYQSQSFSINVNISPASATHTVTLYLLDWDTSNTRVESVLITDLSTGQMLDMRTFSNFSGGRYVQWKIKGNVVMTIIPSGSSSPVVSGIFFDN